MAAVKVTSVKLDTRLLDKLTAETKPKAREVVKQYGLAMTNEAAKLAAVDTGALRNSIVSESAMRTNVTFTDGAMVTDETLTYILQDGVEYGIFIEFGTSKIPARPFMLPAVEKYTQAFLNAFNGLFKV